MGTSPYKMALLQLVLLDISKDTSEAPEQLLYSSAPEVSASGLCVAIGRGQHPPEHAG